MHNLIRSTTFLAIVACLLWSTAFVGVKIGLQYNQPFQFAGMRFLISGLLLLPFASKSGLLLRSIQIYWKKILLISLMQIVLTYTLFYQGLNLVPGALGAIVIGSSPLFIAGLSHFFMDNDRMSLKKVFVIIGGFLGTVLVSLGRDSGSGGTNLLLLGIALLLLNNLLAGFINIVVAKDKGRIPPLVLSATSMIIGGLILLFIAIPTEGLNLGPFPKEYYFALIWLSFLSAAAFTIWFSLLNRPSTKLSQLNMWKFLVPVVGATLSWIILVDESPDVLSVSGMIVTGAALIAMQLIARKE